MTTAAADVPPEMRMVGSVRALKAARRVDTKALAELLGISRSTWFDKMRTGQFTVGEAMALADYFGVSIQSLIDGQLSLPKVRAKLGLIPGGGRTILTTSPMLTVSTSRD